MIKGVNRQILEVTNPDSPYFERVLFFVSPAGGAANENELNDAAQKIATGATRPPKTRRSSREKWMSALYIACGLGAGSALMFVLHTVL